MRDSTTQKKRFSQAIQPYLSQNKFPRFWFLFQFFFGATFDKRRLATKDYSGQKRVLEIGCSVGNISSAFTKYPKIDFTGIDVDDIAITYAKKRFKKFSNFNFKVQDLRKMTNSNTFDYILFAAMLHHVNDDDARELLMAAEKLLSPNGIIVISEPLPAHNNDSWLIRFYYNVFEQGSWVRESSHIEKIISDTKCLKLLSSYTYKVSPFIFRWPTSAHFQLLSSTKVSNN